MAKVITMTRTFLGKHPRKGQSTHFVEQFYNNIGVDYGTRDFFAKLKELNKKNLESGTLTEEELFEFWSTLDVNQKGEKKHTIRANNNFKVGDKVSHRVWSAKPYHTPQIVLWDDIEVAKTLEFRAFGGFSFYLEKEEGVYFDSSSIIKLANNDGLSLQDFEDWFSGEFSGQVIIWDKNVTY